MRQHGMSEFADRFAEKAADTDYSRYPQLQGVDQYDIRAAAEALWWRITCSPAYPEAKEYSEQITDMDVIETLLAKVERYDDDNHLVSVNYEGYWDMTDGLGLSSGLREQMQRELTHKYLREKRIDGFTTVSNQWGIWLFRFEG